MGMFSFFRFGQSSIQKRYHVQSGLPTINFVEDAPATNVDGALQISAVWRSVEIISKLISTLPLFVYRTRAGQRFLDRESSLWAVMHESPNIRMTPAEFWASMIVNLLLRGNAYAQIIRDPITDKVEALWPLSSDSIEFRILPTGEHIYLYRIEDKTQIFGYKDILHIKEFGNGDIGLSRLDFMRASVGESQNAQRSSNKLFANGGKPTGVLMVDSPQDLTPKQRLDIETSLAGLVNGSQSRLSVLPKIMKYEQINLSPEDMQLLTTRQFGVQEIGRWFGIPAVLLNQTEGTTTLGSSSVDIIESFYKLTIRPMIVSIEQAIRRRVMTAAERTNMTVEFNMDGILRSSLKDRVEIYSKSVQNGLKSRNECRQLENEPPFAGGDIYTAQSNLLPIDMLGVVNIGGQSGAQEPISQ